jgi:hypothetical protein
MKTTKFISLACLLLTVLAARGEPPRTDINPALLYYQAFLLAPQAMSEADWDYVGSKTGREKNLPERFGPILAGFDSEFKLAREAAQQQVPCDWGIDLKSKGFDAQLPHLARSKSLAQMAQLRAMWDLQHGNQAGARDDLLAAFVLARNVSRDGTVIGALVQYADTAIVNATVAGNFGQFSPETLKQLEDGFAAAPPPGTMAAAIMTERATFLVWFRDKVLKLQQENPGNDAKVMDTICGYWYVDGKADTNEWQRISTASGGTSDGFLKLLQKMDSLYPPLAEIMKLPPAEYADQIQKFDADLQKSENPLARSVIPNSFQSARLKEFRMQAWQAMVQAAVEYKLHGEAGLKTMMDPMGSGPFTLQRFMFKGVDRGFEIKSPYAGFGYPCALIFVEKTGTPFYTDGPHIGEAVKP